MVGQRQGKYPKWQTVKNMSINDKTAKKRKAVAYMRFTM